MTITTILSLLGFLIFLIILSGFFSSAETGIMALNRYKLRHLATRKKHPSANRVLHLLERPDRLLGVILIGNNFANILASSIATVVAVHFFGDIGLVISTGILTLVILIFAEVAPKTLAAAYPQRVAFFASWPLTLLLKIFYPLVWLTNTVANGLLRLFGVKLNNQTQDSLDSEELRTVVNEAGQRLPTHDQNMLLGVLDLHSVSVDEVMIPRQEVVGIDLEDDWNTIFHQICHSKYMRLPVYYGSLDKVQGIIHLRDLLALIAKEKINKDTLLANLRPAYFIPESTPLRTQLIRFQQKKQHRGLVVDEYGDIQGLVTVDDILEEIVGEFSSAEMDVSKDIITQTDGTYLVDGSVTIRDLNRSMQWNFSTEGAKTLSGLITDYLGMIPRAGTCVCLNDYQLEVIKVKDNRIKTVRVLSSEKIKSN